MRVRDQSLAAQLLRHIENIVHLDHAEIRVQPIKPLQIRKDVAAPTDVAFTRPELELASRRSIHLVVFLVRD